MPPPPQPRLSRGRQRVGPLASAAAAAGPVAVRVEPTRAASQSCAVVGVRLPVNYWVLHALRAGGADALYDAAAFDLSVVAFVAFEAAREKLSGSAVAAIKNRVVDSACGAQDGEFLISVTCAPTLAAARKCAGAVLQSLRWGALYQRYADWCKALGVLADRAAFSHAAAAANAAVQAGVSVVLTGRVEADEAGAARTADLLSRKVKDAPPAYAGRARALTLADFDGGAAPPAGARRAAAPAPLAARFRAHPAPGLPGVAVLNFVDAGARGPPSHLVSGVLYVPAKKEAQAARLARPPAAGAAAASAGRPARYAASLLDLGAETRGALVFLAAKGCLVGTPLLAARGAPLTEGAVAGAIRAALAAHPVANSSSTNSPA